MRRLIPLFFLLLAISPARGYEHWNNIRHSALLPDDTIVVRVESPTDAGQENYLLYQETDIVEALMTSVLDGPSTVSSIVPGAVATPRFYGFRTINGAELDLMPVRIGGGVTPSPADLTRVATDASGDEIFGFTNLDLVDCRISFSATELFASLTNAGGGFPVSQGLGFFGYLLGIVDPAQADPDTVFALMYTYEQAGIISPGLYKVMGTGLDDLEKLGDVAVQEFPGANTLMLSCQLSDLMADSHFQSWYDDADPRIGVAAFTQRITLLGGAQEADRSPGGTCSLREFLVTPGPNTLPVLTNHALVGSGPSATAQIDYLDPDGHCPVIAEIVFDGTDSYPLYPLTLDYSESVTYTTDPGIPPLASSSWTTAVYRFSDDLADVVESEIPGTAVDDSALDSARGLSVTTRPNPFNPTTTIELFMPAPGVVRVAVYDTRGALVRTLMDGPVGAGITSLPWDGRSCAGEPVGSGVYLLGAGTSEGSAFSKLVLIR